MGKKKKQVAQRATHTGAIVGVVGLVFVLTLGIYFFAGGEGRSFQVMGGETRAILNPENFAFTPAFPGYRAAMEFPEVLDKIFCYCGCDKAPFHHKSLKTCFTNKHGAT